MNRLIKYVYAHTIAPTLCATQQLIAFKMSLFNKAAIFLIKNADTAEILHRDTLFRNEFDKNLKNWVIVENEDKQFFTKNE